MCCVRHGTKRAYCLILFERNFMCALTRGCLCPHLNIFQMKMMSGNRLHLIQLNKTSSNKRRRTESKQVLSGFLRSCASYLLYTRDIELTQSLRSTECNTIHCEWKKIRWLGLSFHHRIRWDVKFKSSHRNKTIFGTCSMPLTTHRDRSIVFRCPCVWTALSFHCVEHRTDSCP